MKPNKKSLLQEVDLHVLYMLILFLMPVVFLPSNHWLVIVLAAIPQGQILTRAFIDYPAFKQPAVAYVLVNEAVVAAAVALCLLIWHFVF